MNNGLFHLLQTPSYEQQLLVCSRTSVYGIALHVCICVCCNGMFCIRRIAQSNPIWKFLTTCEAACTYFQGVCLSVCMSCQTITFESLDVGSSFFSHPVCLQEIRSRFVYEGHRDKVKVTGAKKGRKSYISQCETSIGNNSVVL